MDRLRREAWPLVLFALLAASPWIGLGSEHSLSLLARTMALALAAVSLAFLVGGAGLASLGHAAPVGVGAYAVVALDARGTAESLLALPAAAIAATLFALLTGAVALRTRGGVTFLMITLAFGQMAYFGASSLAAYGGDDGYTLAGGRTLVAGRPWLDDRLVFHFVCLGALVVGWAICRAVLASRTGLVLRAGRESELRVQAAGLEPYPHRLAAYGLAGGLAGAAGFLLANAAEFVAPSYMAWQRSAELLFMVILGGSSSLTGAVLGAVAYVALTEGLSGWTEHWRILFGPFLVIVALLARQGLVGLLPGGTGGGRRHGPA